VPVKGDATVTMGDLAADPADPRAFLVVYRATGTEVVDLAKDGEVVVGRDADADLPVDDERASRRHAAFAFDGRALTVRDLGSRNGTTVNGKRISKATPISTGDEVGVGRLRIVAGLRAIATHAGRRLAPWGEIEALLAVSVRGARRGNGAAGLALVAMADDRARTLLAALPDGAVAGQYAPGRVAILLAASSAPAARDALERILRECGEGAAAGLAVAPDDGGDVERIVEAARLAAASARAGTIASPPKASVAEWIVESPAMAAARDLAHRVAPHDTTVLLVGETGTGKEMLAREIHRRSRRAASPFLAVNCGAIPSTLVEPTLFGHERGSFTGATERRDGMFQAANGGTLLLDEVGELSPAAQAAMLRVLEHGEVSRVGSTRPETVDVRVIAATNVDLDEALARGAFRRDLLYRLNSFVVPVPPLRDRPEDLEALALRALAGRPISNEARRALLAYAWPGNVRELLNVLERAVVLAGEGAVEESHLPGRLAAAASGGGNLRARVAGTEAEAIRAALDATNGNRTHAAKRLGISRRALLYKMQKLGLRQSGSGT